MNKQITEDYCSCETAKLLKEKGFDEICSYEWGVPDIDKGYVLQKWVINNGQIRNSDLIDGAYAAPSQSLALKYLREVHGLHIDVFIGSDESHDADGVMVDEWHFWTYYITNTSGDMIYDAYNKVDVIEYQTYEEATEAALLYVLKNLI